MVAQLRRMMAGQFTVTKYLDARDDQYPQNNLTVTEDGKDNLCAEHDHGGEDKDQIRDILNSITNNYLAQNVARKSAEAAKSGVSRSAAAGGAQPVDIAKQAERHRQHKGLRRSAAGGEIGARLRWSTLMRS